MKAILIVLVAGILSLGLGVILQLKSEDWAYVSAQGTDRKIYLLASSEKEKQLVRISEAMSFLGIILISISAFSSTRRIDSVVINPS